MKDYLRNLVLTALLISFCGETLTLAQGTAFTYQGRLNSSGASVNGVYDLRFMVYDAAASGNVISGPLSNSGVGVTNGAFTVLLDFGVGVFTGPARWLQIEVRTNGLGSFALLSPRQPIT